MILLKILLLPLSLIYLLLTKFRNHLFDIGYSRSFSFETLVINVGNLRVGGTGKTPHVEYLIRLLKDQFKIATLSRGYGRKTKGFFLADKNSTAKMIGDEPLQFFTKFAKDIVVSVGEERALAIPTILFEKPETQVIILDDAYQHRTVTPNFNILLSDYNHPFYEDIVLPAGRLRESRNGAKRANAVIVTKCPDDLLGEQKQDIKNKIRKYAEGAPVFFTGIRYSKPQSLFPERKEELLERILLVTGIANPTPLVNEVKSRYHLEKVLDFNDHHEYNEKSIRLILKHFQEIKGNHKAVFTTEKDMVKLQSEPLKKMLSTIPVYYLPIEIYFLEDKQLFDKTILDVLQKEFQKG
jgi:tetraacyldisaccharide 4'-kinase